MPLLSSLFLGRRLRLLLPGGGHAPLPRRASRGIRALALEPCLLLGLRLSRLGLGRRGRRGFLRLLALPKALPDLELLRCSFALLLEPPLELLLGLRGLLPGLARLVSGSLREPLLRALEEGLGTLVPILAEAQSAEAEIRAER